jgi:hypothetical protein
MSIDYNTPEYAAVVFDAANLPDEPKKATKTTKAKSSAVLRPSVSPTLIEDFAATVVKAKNEGIDLNPFLCGFQFDVKKSNGDKIETEKYFDKAGKEIETRHTTIKYVDKKQFLKIYPEILGAMFELNKDGVRLLAIVLNALRECDGQDFLRLRWDEKHIFKGGDCKPVKLSRTGFYRGMDELARLKIIAKKGDDLFWINPNFIFNGNRITFAQRFVLKHEGD